MENNYTVSGVGLGERYLQADFSGKIGGGGGGSGYLSFYYRHGTKVTGGSGIQETPHDINANK